MPPVASESVRKARKKAFEAALADGFQPPSPNLRSGGAISECAKRLNVCRSSIHGWLQQEARHKKAGRKHFHPDFKKYKPRRVETYKSEFEEKKESPFAVEYHPPPAYTGAPLCEIVSRPDNTFCFLAAGDLHAGSKYCRWDVREDLYRRAIAAGAQCAFDTGNWIDGEANFNRYDIEAHGLDAQCRLLAKKHPRALKTYAVWGDDHEGWYVQREGLDVGRYCEAIMREEKHDWTNLGYMEAHVILRNANSRKAHWMAVVHPGGGSAYALSYSLQKIIESLEGGEKPSVGLYGHYHKLWAGLIRNVFALQTGCGQDQTPFMRKKRLEAHVGGILVTLEQDPKTGAIISCTPQIIRYFNLSYYGGTSRWSRHGPVNQPLRGIGG